MFYRNYEDHHSDRLTLGITTLGIGAVLTGVGYALTQHFIETALVLGFLAALLAVVYTVGYVASKLMSLTPAARTKAAEEKELQYAQTVPATMVVLFNSVNGRYDATMCTLFGTERRLFLVGPGTADEIAIQAMGISDQHSANTLCIYLEDKRRSTTYSKSTSGEWGRIWDDEGSSGVARFKKRAALNQRKHEQTVIAVTDANLTLAN
jgi:hypothetical protein